MSLLGVVGGVIVFLFIGLFLVLCAGWNTKTKIENITFFAKISFYSCILQMISFLIFYLEEKAKLESLDYLSVFLCSTYFVLYLIKKDNIIFYFFWHSALSSLIFLIASFFISGALIINIISLAFGFLFNLWLYTYIKKNQDPNSPVLS